jgi:peptide/nickel transport system substrate-binding protein
MGTRKGTTCSRRAREWFGATAYIYIQRSRQADNGSHVHPVGRLWVGRSEEMNVEQENYWLRTTSRSLSRRRLLATAAAVAGLAGADCATRPGRTPSTSTAARTAQETPQTGGVFTSYLKTNYPLDPHTIAGGSNHWITGGVFSRIFRYTTGPDPKTYTDHNLVGDLGVSAESPDAITWTVKLRPDAKFHNISPVNGHPVEAEDVKASYTRTLDPSASNRPNRGTLNMVDPAQIQTPDKNTVVFKLNYPYAPFRRQLASADTSPILPREALAGSYDLSKVVIGSGPFIVDSVTPDVAAVYKRNPEYYEKGLPYVDGLRLAIIPAVPQQLAQFVAGNLDEIIVDNATDLGTVKQSSPTATIIKYDYGPPNPVYFQLGDPTSAFQDIRARQAVSMAIDRDAFSKVFFDGDMVQSVFVPAYMGKWSLRVDALSPSVGQYYKYNPAEAKKLLAATGLTGMEIKLAYIANGATPLYQKYGEFVSNMLSAVGFKTTLIAQDYLKDFIDSGKGSRQGYFDKDVIIMAGSGSFGDADDWFFSYFHSKSLLNQEHLKDPTLDAMMDKERTLVDDDERLKAVGDIHRYLAEKMYAPSIGGQPEYAAIQPRVRNYGVDDGGGKMSESYARIWLKQ